MLRGPPPVQQARLRPPTSHPPRVEIRSLLLPLLDWILDLGFQLGYVCLGSELSSAPQVTSTACLPTLLPLLAKDVECFFLSFYCLYIDGHKTSPAEHRRPTLTPKISLFMTKAGFVVPKNKLAGSDQPQCTVLSHSYQDRHIILTLNETIPSMHSFIVQFHR